MAVDATGTPTSPDNIPKYATSADAPSGKGFNAAMDAIQTALTNSYVRKPSGIAANEAVVWDGSNWIRSSTSTVRISNGGTALPKVTASSFSGGPPASPTDGDIWIASAAGSNGERWQFQYNAGSASTYKWEFIGGPRVQVSDDGNVTVLSTTYVTATAGSGSPQSLTAARAGDWMVGTSGIANAASGVTVLIGTRANGADANGHATQNSSGWDSTYSFENRHNSVAASSTLSPVFALSTTASGNGVMLWRKFWAYPVRVI